MAYKRTNCFMILVQAEAAGSRNLTQLLHFTAPHSRSLSFTLNHSTSLMITPFHACSLHPTTVHCKSPCSIHLQMERTDFCPENPFIVFDARVRT